MFLGRAQRERERVQPGRELRLQRVMDHPVPGHARLSPERLTDQQHAIVCFTARPRPGMASVSRAVIIHAEEGGREGAGQSGFETVCAGLHGGHIG